MGPEPEKIGGGGKTTRRIWGYRQVRLKRRHVLEENGTYLIITGMVALQAKTNVALLPRERSSNCRVAPFAQNKHAGSFQVRLAARGRTSYKEYSYGASPGIFNQKKKNKV